MTLTPQTRGDLRSRFRFGEPIGPEELEWRLHREATIKEMLDGGWITSTPVGRWVTNYAPTRKFLDLLES